MTSNQLGANTVTHSSAAIATSCRCAQVTSRRPSKLSEQTYSHQFGDRQMIKLIRNVGELEGGATASEPVSTCVPSRARLVSGEQLTNDVVIFEFWESAPRHTSCHQRLIARKFYLIQCVGNYCRRLKQPLWQLCAYVRPQKSHLTPSLPAQV